MWKFWQNKKKRISNECQPSGLLLMSRCISNIYSTQQFTLRKFWSEEKEIGKTNKNQNLLQDKTIWNWLKMPPNIGLIKFCPTFLRENDECSKIFEALMGIWPSEKLIGVYGVLWSWIVSILPRKLIGVYGVLIGQLEGFKLWRKLTTSLQRTQWKLKK